MIDVWYWDVILGFMEWVMDYSWTISDSWIMTKDGIWHRGRNSSHLRATKWCCIQVDGYGCHFFRYGFGFKNCFCLRDLRHLQLILPFFFGFRPACEASAWAAQRKWSLFAVSQLRIYRRALLAHGVNIDNWGFPEIGLTPSSHPFLDGIFPYQPSIWGTPFVEITTCWPHLRLASDFGIISDHHFLQPNANRNGIFRSRNDGESSAPSVRRGILGMPSDLPVQIWLGRPRGHMSGREKTQCLRDRSRGGWWKSQLFPYVFSIVFHLASYFS